MTMMISAPTTTTSIVDCENECGNSTVKGIPLCADCLTDMHNRRVEAIRWTAFTRRNLNNN